VFVKATASSVKTADFDYFLPDDLIAAFPTTHRDGSRLFLLARQDGALADADASLASPSHIDLPSHGGSHSIFARIGEHLPPRSLLVLNDTRVLPARLRGHKPTGGAIELLLTRRLGQEADGRLMHWEALGRNLGWAALGTELRFDGGLTAEIVRRGPAGAVEVCLRVPEGRPIMHVLEDVGELPLPPYIELARRRQGSEGRGQAGGEAGWEARRASIDDAARGAAAATATAVLDRERYQTVFAAEAGAVAAPTAGLHFTRELLGRLTEAGHRIVHLTLHVGPGTFRPVKAEIAEDHEMEVESYAIPPLTAAAVNDAHAAGRPIVAVGTTVVRALESSARDNAGRVEAGPQLTGLFLRPGDDFQIVTDLITNFHLPRSTLLMLVCAFAGRERVLGAYAQAVARGYRFYSYGDAMLIRGTP